MDNLLENQVSSYFLSVGVSFYLVIVMFLSEKNVVDKNYDKKIIGQLI